MNAAFLFLVLFGLVLLFAAWGAARVAELKAENEHMRGIFKDLSDWLNKGAIIKATDPALPVVIGPELTTNLHIQGPLAGKEGE